MPPAKHSLRSHSWLTMIPWGWSATAAGSSIRLQSRELCTLWPSVRAKVPCTPSQKPSSNRFVSSRAKTRPSVSYEEIPYDSHALPSWPKSAMATKLPGLQMTPARTAPGCPLVCAVWSGQSSDPRGAQGLDEGRGYRMSMKGSPQGGSGTCP